MSSKKIGETKVIILMIRKLLSVNLSNLVLMQEQVKQEKLLPTHPKNKRMGRQMAWPQKTSLGCSEYEDYKF